MHHFIQLAVKPLALAAGLFAAQQLTAQELNPELSRRLLNAKQGQVVELPGFLTEKMQYLDYQKNRVTRTSVSDFRRSRIHTGT